MAEIQDRSGQRLFPMAIVPWWDVDLAVAEIERIAALGLRGLNTTTAPQDHGLPDLGDEHWNPMWEAGAGARPADQLPHRRQRLVAVVVRIGAVAVAQRRPEARARFGDDVPEQRAGDRQHHLLGRARAVPDAAVRVGRERRRVDPVLPEGARLPGGRDDAGFDGQPLDVAVRLLPSPDPLVLLVRAQRASPRRSRASAPTT